MATNHLPSHTHQLDAVTEAGTETSPANATLAPVGAGNPYRTPAAGLTFVNLAPSAVGSAGGGQAHANLMPTLCVNFIIALFGIYPSRQ